MAKPTDLSIIWELFLWADSAPAIMVVISALQIYFKMQNGEGEISKSIQMLIGACLFMISASIVFPAFFGYQI